MTVVPRREVRPRDVRPSRGRAAAPRAAAAAAGALLVLTGCAGAADAPTTPIGKAGDRSTSGPLSATLDGGGNAVLAPPVTPWKVSFGHFVLCSTRPGAAITVENVTLDDVEVAPRKVDMFVRTVSPSDFPSSGPIPTRLQPLYSIRGSAPHFSEAYADLRAAGSYRGSVAGTRVTQACEDAVERVNGYQELLFTFAVGEEGARVDALTIDYSADGRPYRLPVRWTMVACGTATTGPDSCG